MSSAEYEYIDPATGKNIATKVREEPKDFHWKRNGSAGLGELKLNQRWVGRVPTTARALYGSCCATKK